MIEARRLSQLENTPCTLLAKMSKIIKFCRKQKPVSKELLPVVKEMRQIFVEKLIKKINLIKNTEQQ